VDGLTAATLALAAVCGRGCPEGRAARMSALLPHPRARASGPPASSRPPQRSHWRPQPIAVSATEAVLEGHRAAA